MSDGITLYDGTIRLSFDPGKHAYTVRTAGINAVWSEPKSVPSITTILKVIGKGDALVQWAANCSADYVRSELVPGKPLDEIEIERIANESRFAFRRASKEACDIGMLVHSWVESYLLFLASQGDLQPLPENVEARCACEAAIEWIESHKYRPRLIETRLYSRKYGYAGTADAQGMVASINGKPCIVDWKTSKAIYPEYRLQTAAYAQAISEMTGRRIRERWIVRIGKDGSLQDLRLPESTFKDDLEAFLAAKKIYERLEALKG